MMHHLACHYWSNKTDNILGSSGQEITQKQPKMIVSAGRKTFENLKLENYISNINKNCQVWIPPEHLSFGYFRKKQNRRNWLTVEFTGVNYKQCGIFRDDQKIKYHMEFLVVFVLGLKSSEWCNTVLWNFLG